MDSLIARFPGKPDADLVICEAHGVAYQADMTAQRVPYGADYLAKVQAYEGSPIATKVHAGRLQMLRRHLKPGASLLDWGAGSGEFVRDARGAGYAAKGFDVIAETRAALVALAELLRDGALGDAGYRAALGALGADDDGAAVPV